MAKNFKVGLDDCISSIAFENGFYWETLWNHPNNANLKNDRKDPNILKPDDIVHIPDLRLKEVTKPNEQVHKFKLKGLVKLRLRVLEEPKPKDPPPPPPPPDPSNPPKNLTVEDPQTQPEKHEDVPRKNTPYKLTIERRTLTGETDGDGMLDVQIPANAKRGVLVIDPGNENEATYKLRLGRLTPLSELSGIKIRLRNLGFDCGNTNDEEGPSFAAALKAFQEKNGLEQTGTLNDETRAKLKEIHKS
jgi:N-acetylmuramoyl-L-alanine amidase